MGRKDQYIIHTDGAYSRKHDEGAYAYVICDGQENEIYRDADKITNETNNRAELKAIIAALQNLPEDAKRVRIESDSQDALNTLAGRWKRNVNIDLFEISDEIISKRELQIKWCWVKGHSGDVFNEICDKMCQDVLGYDPSEEYAIYKKQKPYKSWK